MGSPPVFLDFCVALCFLFVLSSFYVLCAQWCQYLWTVHSRLPFRFLLRSFEHHSLHLFLTLYAEYVCFVISKSERKLQAFCFAISMLNRNLQPLCYFMTKSKKKATSFISWHNFVCLYTCILYNGTIVCSLSSVVSGDLYVFLYVIWLLG